MRAASFTASLVRHAFGAAAEGLLVAAILAALLLALSPIYAPATQLAGTGTALAGRVGTIQVTFDGSTARVAEADATGSIFTSWGCGFRANSPDYYMVVRGPAPDTASLAYWVDPFVVGSDGCGRSTVSWTSSGVPGDFDVYVVRSASGNPWQAQPASNVVTVTITAP
jgi:hypothetical protein